MVSKKLISYTNIGYIFGIALLSTTAWVVFSPENLQPANTESAVVANNRTFDQADFTEIDSKQASMDAHSQYATNLDRLNMEELRLEGIVGVDNDWRAIIKKSSSEEPQTYQVGVELATGVIINNIEHDRVILLAGNILKVLRLTQSKSTESSENLIYGTENDSYTSSSGPVPPPSDPKATIAKIMEDYGELSISNGGPETDSYILLSAAPVPPPSDPEATTVKIMEDYGELSISNSEPEININKSSSSPVPPVFDSETSTVKVMME